MEENILYSEKVEMDDGFHTQLIDIEKELKFYRQHFQDKKVYSNCGDISSNFWSYFGINFKFLKLKKFTVISYQRNLKDNFYPNSAVLFEDNGERDEKNLPKDYESKAVNLKGNGDFRNKECVLLLIDSDVVVSNPPSSLFVEYINQLISFNKNFLVLGNLGRIYDGNFLSLMKEEKIWMGVSAKDSGIEVLIPEEYPLTVSNTRVNGEGERVFRLPGMRWFTNLVHEEKPENIILHKKYSSSDYQKYDNYDAIDVPEIENIPEDYDKEMGVPSIFLDYYNSDQFEIIGSHKDSADGIFYLNNEPLPPRIIIKMRT